LFKHELIIYERVLKNERTPANAKSFLALAVGYLLRTIWIVDAHGYGKRFIVRAEELLTAFLELERAIHEFAVDLISQ
jgi:hypothetical protein